MCLVAAGMYPVPLEQQLSQAVSNTNGRDEHSRSGDESGITVFGGGGRGCAGRGCLFWIVASIVLSVTLTILVNLIPLLFSGGG